MPPAQARIVGMIGSIRRRWLALEAAMFLGGMVATLSLWLGAMIGLDNALILEPWQLLAGWAALAAVYLAWLGWALFRLTAGRPRAKDLALMYESGSPGQANRLVNAVDFLASGLAGRDAMALAAVQENAARLDPAGTRRAVSGRAVRHAMLVTVAALLALLGYSALWPALAANAVQRLLSPASPPLHLQATQIRVAPGNADLVEGQPLAIDVTLAHNLPPSATLEYRVGKLGWTAALLEKTSPSAFRYGGFKAVWQPVHYRVRAGRSTSPTYEATVALRPRVLSLQVTTTLPPYAGGTVRALKPNVGEVSALIGSTVEMAVSASCDITSGGVEFADGSTVPLSLDTRGPGSPRDGRATFTLKQSGSYAIRLTDRAGLSNVNPPRYALTALEDQAPLAVFTIPGRDLVLPPTASVPLVIEAEDDIGLASVAVQVRGPGRDWTNLEDWPVPEPDARKRHYNTNLTLAKMGLKVNDVVLYRLTAADHRQPQPNHFTGRSWSITIAQGDDHANLLAAEAKRLLDALSAILALQKEARGDVDMDRPVEPIRSKQDRVRGLTIDTIAQQRQSVRPAVEVIDPLQQLADGLMLRAIEQLGKYQGTYQARQPLKAPLLATQDQIIAKLEELIGKVNRQLALAEKAQEAIDKLSPADREQALRQMRDLLEKLRAFVQEQDKVVENTEELVRKAPNFNAQDLQKFDALKGTEDKWSDVFKGSVKDIQKLTEQVLPDQKVANDYKQMVEHIEEAAKNLNPKLVTLAVPREQSGREMAKELAQDMEMWLPNSPDNIKWVMEEPLDKPEIPMAQLPDNLSDLIGDLIAEEDKLTQEADDVTSAWADSISAAGWGVSDGPISNFSAKGKTGNQLPNNNELSGRAGDGRSGKSQGQMVGDTAKGLEGRKTPTRVTNDPYEKGAVKELQQMAAGGATGGGKARGAGQEGLQGNDPPPTYDKKTDYMKDWQQKIREKAERTAGQLKSVRIDTQNIDKAIDLMKKAEQAARDGRYTDLVKTQQMVMGQLRTTQDGIVARDQQMRVDQAFNLPAGGRKDRLDAGDEPVPAEYHDAVRRYFEKLSQ